ncbi:MAG: GNAT family N-acetyltransferase [Acidimicrobiia bacterium]|nr:GNAT family N-acetyltransferase [Acidimicrobiia bacterium]
MAASSSPEGHGPFTIRSGQEADVNELWRLVGLLAGHLGDQHRYRSTPESFARYGFGARPMFQTLLAIDDRSASSAGAVGACVYLPDFSTWLARPGVYILDLVVEPEHRGRRIGSALLAEAARRGREQWDADYLILAVDRANHHAVRFYEREGFEADDDSRVMIRRSLRP